LGAAKTIGAKVATMPYMVFLDNDTNVTNGWLRPLLSCLANKEVGAVQSFLITPEKGIQHSGGILNSLGLGFSAHIVGLEPRSSTPTPVFFAAGAGMAIRRNMLHRIGFFDPHLMFTDDIDLSWRLNLLGKKILVCPSSIVIHRGSATVGSKLMKIHRENCFSFELLHVIFKNYSARNIAENLPKTLFLLAMMFFQRINSGNPKCAFASINGIFQFIQTFPKMWPERVIVQRTIRRVADHMLQKTTLIVDWAEIVRFAYSLASGKRPVGPLGKFKNTSR
jgi:GT2 family glycosyltransferase